MMKEKRLTREDLLGYAKQVGLDLPRFTRELDSEQYRPLVEADVALARNLDFYQTPSFVINGRVLVGERPIENFRKLIDAALAEQAGGE